MAVADWKSVNKEPEDYGVYLIKVRGREESTVAHFDHPNDEPESGWFEVTQEGLVKVEAVCWDYMPG